MPLVYIDRLREWNELRLCSSGDHSVVSLSGLRYTYVTKLNQYVPASEYKFKVR